MKKILLALCVIFMSTGLMIEDAEARRMGGGRSFGMQRQATPPAAAPKSTQNATAPKQTPPTAGAPARSGWMGPIAGLAAGLGLAALASHLGFGEGLANFMMIALLAIAAVVVFRLLFRKKTAPDSSPLQYAGAQNRTPTGTTAERNPSPVNSFGGQSFTPTSEPVTTAVPDDFDTDGFLRVAKVNFVRLQAAHDAGNLDDIREFTTPEVFAEIKLDLDDRKHTPQQTDVVTLEAELVDLQSENNRYIASVRFHGMIREDSEGAAEAFNEIWHLTKPINGPQGWMIAGIQQVQ